MKLILVRHGEAGHAAVDADRELTATGRADISRAALVISATGWNVKSVLTSPLRRTVETGRILADSLGKGTPVRAENELAPGILPESATALIGSTPTSDAVIWVFHAPDVMRIASYLTGNPENSFYFTPGTMVALNLSLPGAAGRGMVIFAMPPEFLRLKGL